MTGDTEARAVTLQRMGRLALITLNRPEALNAVNRQLAQQFGEALTEVQQDDHLRVAVVTGAGRAFCAGADLKELAAGVDISAPGHSDWGFAGMVNHPIEKPLIAAVNGIAFGGGMEIVLACDLAVMNREAALALPEVRRGLFAAAGGLIQLPRELPLKVAMEVALTGEPLSADEAHSWGLVNRLAPAEAVVSVAISLAEAVAANAPLAVQSSKRILRRAVGRGSQWDHDLLALQGREVDTVFSSIDAAEGASAFADRRPPNWVGA